MKKHLFLAIASLILGSQVQAETFTQQDVFYCSFHGETTNGNVYIGGDGQKRFKVEIQDGSTKVEVKYLVGEAFFRVSGVISGVDLSTSVAFDNKYTGDPFSMGSLTLKNTNTDKKHGRDTIKWPDSILMCSFKESLTVHGAY